MYMYDFVAIYRGLSFDIFLGIIMLSKHRKRIYIYAYYNVVKIFTFFTEGQAVNVKE